MEYKHPNCKKCKNDPKTCGLSKEFSEFPQLICDGYWVSKGKVWQFLWNLKYNLKKRLTVRRKRKQ